MKTKVVGLFIFLSLFMFFSSLGISAYRLSHLVEYRNNEITTSFKLIENLSENYLSLSSDTGLITEEWVSNITKEYRDKKYILSLIVRSEKSGILHMIPRNNPYVSESSTKVEYSFPIFSVKLKTFSSYAKSEIIYTDVLYCVLDQNDIFQSILPSLYLIAGWTFICLVLLIIVNNSKSASSISKKISNQNSLLENIPYGKSNQPSQKTFANFSNQVDDYSEKEDFQFSSDSEGKTGYDKQISGIPKEKKPFSEVQHDYSDTSDVISENIEKNPKSTSDKIPTGLYSPDTGLGWSTYLPERLESELNRSAAFEQDLVLMIVLFEESAQNEEAYIVCAKTALDFFGFRDLSFELGENGFAFILPNIDIKQGLKQAEEFFKKATFILKDYRNPLLYLDLHIGLSSRSGRLISAERLITEAESALEQAKIDHDSHIIAFITDADKYRAFISSKSK